MSLPLSFIMGAGYLVVVLVSLAGFAATGEPLVAAALLVAVVTGGVLLSLAFAVVLNAAFTRAELTESFGDALSPGALVHYSRTTWHKVIVKSIAFAFVGFGIVLCGMALFCVGLYPAMVILQIAGVHLRWQIYRYHVGRDGEPISVKEPQAIPSETARAPYGYAGLADVPVGMNYPYRRPPAYGPVSPVSAAPYAPASYFLGGRPRRGMRFVRGRSRGRGRRRW